VVVVVVVVVSSACLALYLPGTYLSAIARLDGWMVL
jgi:hypothetical protein